MNTNAAPSEPPISEAGVSRYSRTIADLPGPKGQPLLGNILQLGGRRSHLALAQWTREFGPILRVSAFGQHMVLVSDRNEVNAILKNRPIGFRRPQSSRDVMNELKIGGVFAAEGDDWRKQRKLVLGALNVQVVRNFFPRMIAITERLLARWKAKVERGEKIDLRRDLKAMALDLTVGIAMGYESDSMSDESGEFQRNINRLFLRLERRVGAPFPYWHYLKLPADRAAERSANAIEESVKGFVGTTRARMQGRPELKDRPTNMLESMAASDESGSAFTDEELVGNAMLSVIAGMDPIANTLAWMIIMLASNPAAASRLTDEVDRVLNGAAVVNDWEDMKRFPYLEATHSETQRLRPVAPLIGLVSNAECVIAETLIPKDTLVIVSTIGDSGLDSRSAENAAFQPERWIVEPRTEREEDPTRRLFPFGGGARLCPGRFLALTEIKIVASMLLRTFELEYEASAPPVQQIMNFFVAPSAVPVRLKLRDAKSSEQRRTFSP